MRLVNARDAGQQGEPYDKEEVAELVAEALERVREALPGAAVVYLGRASGRWRENAIKACPKSLAA
jgi:hypothetical protein